MLTQTRLEAVAAIVSERLPEDYRLLYCSSEDCWKVFFGRHFMGGFRQSEGAMTRLIPDESSSEILKPEFQEVKAVLQYAIGATRSTL